MTKRITIALAILGVFSVCLPAGGQPWDGNGVEGDPYLIYTPEDMQAIGADPNYWDAHFNLCDDIDLSGFEYTTALIAPDTNNSIAGFQGPAFTGVFDGADHRVSNLIIDDGGVGADYLGLFGYTENAEINDLSVENVSIRVEEGSFFIGGLVGFNDTSTIINCNVSGEISAERYSRVIGGMIGRNIDGEIANCNTANDIYPGMHTTEIGGLIGSNVNGAISNCYTTGAVSGEYMSNELGGLIGRCNDGTITDCYATGTVNGYMQLGGLIGHNVDNIVTNCYATGTLTGGAYGIGGLIGENAYAQINNCYAVGAIFGEHYSSQLGGLIGRNNGGDNDNAVMNSFATGTVTGGDSSEYLGGLIGANVYAITIGCYATGIVTSGEDSYSIGGLVGKNHYSNIIDCYANGSVVSGDNSDSIGGLVGFNRYSSSLGIGIISNCYATGEVLGGNNSQNLGGFAGYINKIEQINGFWNSTVNPDVNGVGNTNDPNVIGETTVNMQMASTFTSAGWDFVGETVNGTEDIWRMCVDDVNYPMLWWEFVDGDFGCPDGVDGIDLGVLCEQWLFEKLPADVAPEGGDGVVNFLDWADFAAGWQVTNDYDALADFAEQWLKTGTNYLIADIAPAPAGDKIVNFLDFAVLAEEWLN